jgi:hypothetical protein
MALFFHWHRPEGRWHDRGRDRWGGERREEPRPGFPFPPRPGFPFPLPLLETGEGENGFVPGEREAETHGYRRRRWARYQGSDQSGETENGFAPEGAETETRRRTGRWVRRHNRIILLRVDD